MLDLGLRKAGDTLYLFRIPFRCMLSNLIYAVNALAYKFLVFPAVLENVPQHAVDRGDVGAWAHPHIFGGVGRGPRHPRINHDHVGAVKLLAFQNVLQRDRMRLSRIAAHHQNGLGITDVVVAVRHRTIAPGIGYAGHGRGMTDTRLMI